MAETVVSSVGTIAKIALQIKEAVQTVRRNEDECRKIARSVEINSGILQRLVQGTEITKHKVMCDALEDVKTTFEDCLDLVKKCQSRHFISRIFLAKDIASDLSMALRDIGLKMQQATSCGATEAAIAASTLLYSLITTAPPTGEEARIHYILVPQPPPPGEEAKTHCAGNTTAPPPLPPTAEEARVSYVVNTTDQPRPPSPTEEEGSLGDIVVSTRRFRRFSFSVLNKATNNFSDENKIGQGGFVQVYKGVLHDGQEVAIKKFVNGGIGVNGSDNFCLHEFIIGTKLRHKNVVSLLGYGLDVSVDFVERYGGIFEVEEWKRVLVLGYVPNGTLWHIITGKRHIDWSSCFRIIQEIAQGVHYIHEQRVIHLDLNPSNILLHSDMTPVISDFGISKVLEDYQDKINLDFVCGTPGYMAPEQFSYRTVSFKSDVFTFGLTLLKTIMSGDAIEKYDTTISPSGPWLGREYWEPMLERAGGLKELVNPAVLVDESQLTEVDRCLKVGMLCQHPDPEDRPSMADVVDMLSGKKQIPIPKKEERASTMKLGRADLSS